MPKTMVEVDGLQTTVSVFSSTADRSTSSFSSTIRPAHPQAHQPSPERKSQVPGDPHPALGKKEKPEIGPAQHSAPGQPKADLFPYSLLFSIDEQTQRLVVAVVVDHTQEVIRRFPLDENGIFKLADHPFNTGLVNVYI